MYQGGGIKIMKVKPPKALKLGARDHTTETYTVEEEREEMRMSQYRSM
jgi:hypothetical protein